jgi:hypothetical protein
VRDQAWDHVFGAPPDLLAAHEGMKRHHNGAHNYKRHLVPALDWPRHSAWYCVNFSVPNGPSV